MVGISANIESTTITLLFYTTSNTEIRVILKNNYKNM